MATPSRVVRDPRGEERAARARARQVERALRAARKAREREQRASRGQVIREERARRPGCRCPISPRSTPDELRALGAGCTAGSTGAPGWVCPCLDAIRRRLRL